jgi:hypothetical protein
MAVERRKDVDFTHARDNSTARERMRMILGNYAGI